MRKSLWWAMLASIAVVVLGAAYAYTLGPLSSKKTPAVASAPVKPVTEHAAKPPPTPLPPG